MNPGEILGPDITRYYSGYFSTKETYNGIPKTPTEVDVRSYLPGMDMADFPESFKLFNSNGTVDGTIFPYDFWKTLNLSYWHKCNILMNNLSDEPILKDRV